MQLSHCLLEDKQCWELPGKSTKGFWKCPIVPPTNNCTEEVQVYTPASQCV